MKSMDHLDMQVRLTIFSDNQEEAGTFGKGVATLLEGIRNHGSLNASAKQIHMAYSKAWRIIKEAESCLGFALLERQGALGSTLTDEGLKLLDVYQQLESESTNQLDKRFHELLKISE